VDKGSIGGIVLAIGMISGALAVMASHGHGHVNLMAFLDIPAMMLIGGGSFAVAMIGFPLKQSLGAFKLMLKVCFNRPAHPKHVIDEIVKLGEVARRDGILALEQKLAEIEDANVVAGIQMVVDGTRPEVVHETMTKEIEMMQHRHRECKKMIELVGRCGPAFGMVATLLGLILMLGNLSDPDSIGPSMAVALVGTMYGALAANMVAIPFSEKLGGLSAEEAICKEIIMQGVLAIQAGDSPRLIERKLQMYLPPKQRTGGEKEG
jgi:chemotaxis protein MotA